MKIATLTVGLMAATLSFAPVTVFAGPPKWAPGHKNSASYYAPGQVKKRHAHDHREHLRGDYVYVNDYARWGLNPPPAGHTYVRKNGEILEVVKDTLAIVGAVAVVDALLN